MNLVDQLKERARPIWETIVRHPFVVELYTGRLPLDKFSFFILQDYHYLVTAMKNFAVIASKAPSVPALRAIIDILDLEAKSEFDGYTQLLDQLGHTPDEAAGISPMPVTVAYSNFLLSTSSLKSYAESIVSVLPCFWSYAEIAERHCDELETNAVEIYRAWGQAYLSDAYLQLVEKLKTLANDAAEAVPYEALETAFMTASRYELMFWEASYRQEKWPV
jgi:thiaminase (transcriptional activator TenA)